VQGGILLRCLTMDGGCICACQALETQHQEHESQLRDHYRKWNQEKVSITSHSQHAAIERVSSRSTRLVSCI